MQAEGFLLSWSPWSWQGSEEEEEEDGEVTPSEQLKPHNGSLLSGSPSSALCYRKFRL